ncbi:MAG: OmpA family protein [Candidatus Coatesbacteria bacterium]
MRALLCAFMVTLAPSVWASGAGTTGANGVKLSSGARPESLGGAYVGLADDLSALFWNPAGLALLQSPEASFLHTAYVAETSYDVLAYAQPLGAAGTVAGALNLLSYGSFGQASARGGGLMDSLSPADVFVTGAWGTAVPPFLGLDKLRLGGSVKMTFQSLTNSTESGLALTGGLLWDTPVEGLRAGTTVDNAGAVITGSGLMPLAWRLGASYARDLAARFRGVAVADTLVQLDAGFHGGLGVEVTGYDLVALRLGWRGGGAEGGPTAGLGARYPARIMNRALLFKLDYALATHGVLGTAHRVQLGVALAGPLLGRIRDLRVEGDAQHPRLAWSGSGPAYLVFVRKAGDSSVPFRRLMERPLIEAAYEPRELEPGAYRIRVAAVDPERPNDLGAPKETDLTVAAPPPPPAPVAPPLTLSLAREGLVARLVWANGTGPAYDAFVLLPGNPVPVKLTHTATAESSCVVKDLAPGAYAFRVVTVDPARPGWQGSAAEATLTLDPPPAQMGIDAIRTVQDRLGKIVFVIGKTDLAPSSAAPLLEVVELMAKFPQLVVEVEGHTDSTGGAAQNLKVSQLRAEAVVKFLVAKGVAPARLTAKGYGGTRPVEDNKTSAGQAANRRVEFAVSAAVPAAVPSAAPVQPTIERRSEPAVATATEPAVSTATEPAVATATAADELKTVQGRLGKIVFQLGKTVLDPKSEPALAGVAEILARYPGVRVEVEGHTDSTGSAGFNVKVSQARAEAVVRYLVDRKGVAADRLTAKGYGGAKPIADNQTDAGQAANRRVEFRVIEPGNQ